MSPSVVLTGQSKWATVIGEGLKRHTDLTVRVVPADAPGDLISLLRIGTADAIIRVGFRPGAYTWRGRIFDFVLHSLALRGRETAVGYYWIGTDVQGSLHDSVAGRSMKRFRRLTRDAFHLTDSEGLQHELRTLGIESTVLYIPGPNALLAGDCPPFPAKFTVLSYVPDERPSFYGAETLLEVARRLPDVTFLIARGTGTWAENPPANVVFLGWVADGRSLYTSCTCYVRTLEHDGTSCMVLEALSAGRVTLYSEPFPHTTTVPFGDTNALDAALRLLRDAHLSGNLAPDERAAAWARQFADPQRCFTAIGDTITAGIEQHLAHAGSVR